MVYSSYYCRRTPSTRARVNSKLCAAALDRRLPALPRGLAHALDLDRQSLRMCSVDAAAASSASSAACIAAKYCQARPRARQHAPTQIVQRHRADACHRLSSDRLVDEVGRRRGDSSRLRSRLRSRYGHIGLGRRARGRRRRGGLVVEVSAESEDVRVPRLGRRMQEIERLGLVEEIAETQRLRRDHVGGRDAQGMGVGSSAGDLIAGARAGRAASRCRRGSMARAASRGDIRRAGAPTASCRLRCCR